MTKKACSGFSIRSYRKPQIFVSSANNLWWENSAVARSSLTLYESYQCTELALIRKLINCPHSRWWEGRLGNLASGLESISLLLGNQKGPTTSLVHHTSVYLTTMAYKNGSGIVEFIKEGARKDHSHLTSFFNAKEPAPQSGNKHLLYLFFSRKISSHQLSLVDIPLTNHLQLLTGGVTLPYGYWGWPLNDSPTCGTLNPGLPNVSVRNECNCIGCPLPSTSR